MIKRTKVQSDLRSFILVVIAVASMAGILLDSILQVSQIILLIGAVIALACTILCWQDSKMRYTSLISLWLLLGAWRYAISSPIGDPTSISAFISARKLDIQGTVADDPKLLKSSRRLLVIVNAISFNNGTTWQDAHGQIEVELLGAPLDNPYGPNYGDTIEMQGQLQPPFPDHSPEVLASMSFPSYNVTGSAGNPIISSILKLRLFLASVIEQSLPQPEAALLIAILLSLQTPVMQPLIQAFTSTGTAHLIAPSGFKITILAGIVYSSTNLFSKRRHKQLTPLLPAQKREGHWRQWIVTSLVILCILVYSILSGAGPAAQRACIMGIILALAPRFGRIYNIYTAMAMAVLIMCLSDPFVMWNTGFQLSTIGTLGIVVLTPLLLRAFRSFENVLFIAFISETIAVTLAAEIATLPIFASTFQQVSLIAAPANVLTVPLLNALIALGLALCITGAILPPIGIFFGVITWPLLWYIKSVVTLFASIPLAFLTLGQFDTRLAWSYYGVLILILILIKQWWPEKFQAHRPNVASKPQSLYTNLKQAILENNHEEGERAALSFPQRSLPVLRYAAAMIVILALGSAIAAAPANEGLSITLLNVGPIGKPAQGEAILIRTVDGKTALIDGGPDATSLGEELDSRLPFWQRSIDTVILTSPRQDHLVGAQDVISRFQVSQALDAGMLHPNTGYALWKHTINTRNIPYSQVREGSFIQAGSQASIQVLWPHTLHKGTGEEYDNALILRLVTPSFNMLLLGTAALSSYALSGLLSTIDPTYLKANIVQIVGEVSKSFPLELTHVLALASPSLLVVTPSALSSKQNKSSSTSILLPSQMITGPWQVIQTAQAGSITINSSAIGWNVTSE
ncbi:MAG TPA: ComEC/Rec2 family competence protein [Ktedonobacteraceae bacterium]|nr:ComEC/Rec2 family competence protein [Ktedonobacteraceae bacterium]